MEGTPDIGKIVSMIMENPKLIEEISGMVRSEQKPSAEDSSETTESTAVSTAAQPAQIGSRRRSELLCALKPYVSRDRAQAIDSMITVVEILDRMKGR